MITWFFVPLGLILPDQPNRAVRTRMLRGVGGGSCEAPPYPDMPLVNLYFSNSDSTWRHYCKISHYFIFMIDNGRRDYICL